MSRRILLAGILGLAALIGSFPMRAQPSSTNGQAFTAVNAFPNLTFDDPTCIVPLPGTNRLYVCGRQGQIWFFNNSPTAAIKTLFLDLSAHTQGWGSSGLLAMAFHPQFGQAGSPNRGYVYVAYTYTPGPLVGSAADPPVHATPCYDRISRFTVPDGSDVADPNSEYVLVNQFDPDLWHNGCAMYFGADGYLYFTNGDEGGNNDVYQSAQQINVGLFSGVFRIDVDENPVTSHPIRRQPKSPATAPAGWPGSYTQGYYIPNDNPWQDPTGGTLEEFYALGLREPWRMTRDPLTGTVWLGDVGQDQYEELDILQPGANYQWAYREGFHPGPFPKPSPLIGTDTPPIYEYPHAFGNGCVVGGYVYRGTKFASLLGGQYLFGDYNSNRVWAVSYGGSGTPVINYVTTVPGRVSGSEGALTTFGEDQNGEIYLATLGPSDGAIYKLALPGAPGYLTNISARAGVAGAAQPLIAGFVVGGSGSKTLLLRGIGPTLTQYGVANALPRPLLQVYDASSNLVAQDSGWCNPASNQPTVTAADQACGAFALPSGSSDSALVQTVAGGLYTIQVKGLTAAPGVSLAEIYDDSPPGGSDVNPPVLVNLSARAMTAPGLNLLTAGFVIQGATPLTVLIRGVGPTLAQYGVAGAVADPQLTLFDASGNIIAQNDNWGDSANAAQIASTADTVGAFALPAGSKDAALLLTLAPGLYTAQVSGAGGTSGQALVEVYAVPY
jgi:glucose/arabinose dehydrogenase